MKHTVLTLVILTLISSYAITQETNSTLYKDNPEIIKLIKAIKPGEMIQLPKFDIAPAEALKYHPTFKNGPGVRDYCNKIVYAPDRKSGMYCGANHGVPHRLNDVWEFHLGSNTWNLICPPGKNATKLRGHANKLKKNPEDKESMEKIKVWYTGVVMKDGYLQDKANGGPVRPWHTWDGITYDVRAKTLYWNVLDTQNFTGKNQKNNIHQKKIRTFAKYSNQDSNELIKRLKPASSMYIYDPEKKRWKRQQGEGPFPLMRSMGGTIHYIPDIDKTIFYICAGNMPGGYTEGMWTYDSKTNKWENLIVGSKVRNLVHKDKVAPGEELQVAYSSVDKKLVAVQKNSTFIYDFKTNTWSRGAQRESFGHDAKSTFDYDSSTDQFLLLARKGTNQWAKSLLAMYSYDIKTNKWQKTEMPLLKDNTGAKWKQFGNCYAGYYEPTHQVFVLYGKSKSGVMVYRHKK
ncbi:MAG: hypothetical protein COA79_15545 [Planctomycetota bacterium]|nr:MAG: hypothetical protein COA79_15545 [Planctomycetota bacterium]